jgi:hypothetical protein
MGGGRLPVDYSRYITTAQLHRGSDVTRGSACRLTVCANSCETYSDLRTCEYLRLVSCELIANSYYIPESVLQIDKVSQLILYVRIDWWEQCDGSKYLSYEIVVVLIMPQCQYTES